MCLGIITDGANDGILPQQPSLDGEESARTLQRGSHSFCLSFPSVIFALPIKICRTLSALKGGGNFGQM